MDYLKENLPVYKALLDKGYKPEDFTALQERLSKIKDGLLYYDYFMTPGTVAPREAVEVLEKMLNGQIEELVRKWSRYDEQLQI